MRYSFVFFILIMESSVLLILPSVVLPKIKRGITWSILEYESKLVTDTNINWDAIFCHTIKRPTTIFTEVYMTNQSHETQNFFKMFIGNLYHTPSQCINAMILSTVVIGFNPTESILWSSLRKSYDNFYYNTTASMTIPQVESFVFNNPTVTRVMIMPLTKIESFMEYTFVHWHHKQHVVMLIILKNYEITAMCDVNIVRIVTMISRDILEALWKRRGIYNVLIGFPSLNILGTKLWSYDPFYHDDITGNSGRIVEIDPSMPFDSKQLRNLYGYKLNIGLFEAKLTAEVQSAEFYSKDHIPVIGDFHGVDGYMVQTMSKYFNFTVAIVPPFGGVKYGHVENGTAVGTLGDAAYHRIHASFNSQYIKDYFIGNQQIAESLNTEFTFPVDWDRVCIIVPSSDEIPRWLRTFIYMQPAIWLCLLIAVILATIVWHLLRNYHPSACKNYYGCDKKYSVVFLDTFMLLIGAPVRTTNVFGERILVGALAFLGLTVMGAFTGTLYHSFTNEMYYRPIETLKELDELGLTVATSSPNLEDIFGPKNNIDRFSTFSRLAHKIRSLPNNVSTIRMTAYERNIAAIYREKVFLIEQHQYVDTKGRSLLHLVPECPQAYHLAYLLPANSILMEPFNSFITALNEGGIIFFWNNNGRRKSSYDKMQYVINNVKDQDPIVPKSFSIGDMEICFLILAVGMSLSIICFIVECINMKNLSQIFISARRSVT